MQDTAGHGTAALPEAKHRNGHEPEPNPFDTPAAEEKRGQAAQAQAAAEQRLKRWRPYCYAAECLPGGQTWARSLAHQIGRTNAARNPVKFPPQLMFRGDEAVKAGATDEQIDALPRLTSKDIAELTLRQAAQHEAARMQVRHMARRLIAARDRPIAPPQPVTLVDLLAEPDDDATYRIGELWPVAGRVLLAAQYKSGKSTLVGNVIRALVDGGSFLGRFDVTPVRKVALIDTELDARTLRRWLRDQSITNTAAVSVLSLRGAVSSFDILDPATRTEWAQRLSGVDVVILDCVRPVLDALGLSEDKDAGRVLVAFDALLAEVGATEGMVVTHMGHQGERARGDSRLLDWPDALWKIVRGGGTDDENDAADAPRYLSALGRDVALSEGLLSYDTATRHLSYAGGTRRDTAATAAMPELMALVRLEPGLSKRKVEDRLCDEHGLPRRSIRSAVKTAIANGSVVVTTGERGAHSLSPGADPFLLPDAAPTG